MFLTMQSLLVFEVIVRHYKRKKLIFKLMKPWKKLSSTNQRIYVLYVHHLHTFATLLSQNIFII